MAWCAALMINSPPAPVFKRKSDKPRRYPVPTSALLPEKGREVARRAGGSSSDRSSQLKGKLKTRPSAKAAGHWYISSQVSAYRRLGNSPLRLNGRG